MILSDVGMLAVESNRTRVYLQQMVKQKLLPAMVLLMEGSVKKNPETIAIERKRFADKTHEVEGEIFDLNLSVREYLEANSIPFQLLLGLDPNHADIIHAVTNCQPSILIYSGPGGAILRHDILSTGKQFLHVHPGFLPDYKGSTTIYYSLIKDNLCGASAFFMTEKIDNGSIILREIYPPPADRTTIDLWYDSYIRSDLLLKILKDYVNSGKIKTEPQPVVGSEIYFIIHPVLKHIAILSI